MSEDDGNTDAIHLTDDAIREMRNVAHHLLPETLSRHGLRTTLRDYCQTMRNVTFSFIGDEQYLDKRQEEHLYCIVYELVNNAVKNAQAQHIDVQLLIDNHLTAISVSDDGNGLTTADPPAGSGLRNIRERVEALGGTFRLQASPQKGTEVSIELPATARNHQK
jgi:signal transduction histidine kinase